MTISLTNGDETANLSERLDWQDEFSWSPVEQSTAYSTKGALLVDTAVKKAGRPITLVGTETAAWMTRNACTKLQSWADVPGLKLTLVLRGQSRLVIFDHARGGFAAQPVWKLTDAEHKGDTLYLPTFRFIEV